MMKTKTENKVKTAIYIFLLIGLSYLAIENKCPQLEPKLQNDIEVVTLETEGYRELVIYGTGSMEPLVSSSGARAIVKKVVTGDTLRNGNILVFFPEYMGYGIAHRLVNISGETLIMSGDTSDEIQLVDCCDDIFKVYALIKLREK